MYLYLYMCVCVRLSTCVFIQFIHLFIYLSVYLSMCVHRVLKSSTQTGIIAQAMSEFHGDVILYFKKIQEILYEIQEIQKKTKKSRFYFMCYV